MLCLVAQSCLALCDPMDSSPPGSSVRGDAGKEGPQLARTGASQGFPRAAAPVGVFSRGIETESRMLVTRGWEEGQQGAA